MNEPVLNVESSPAPAEITPVGHAMRVVARGEIDSTSAHILQETFSRLIDDGATLLLFDASHVEFMDSSGLRVIVSAGNRLSANGGRLFVEKMSGAVQRVLEISGLLESYRSPSDPSTGIAGH